MVSLEICDLEKVNSESTRHVDMRTPNAMVRLCLVYLRKEGVWDWVILGKGGRTADREGSVHNST